MREHSLAEPAKLRAPCSLTGNMSVCFTASAPFHKRITHLNVVIMNTMISSVEFSVIKHLIDYLCHNCKQH